MERVRCFICGKEILAGEIAKDKNGKELIFSFDGTRRIEDENGNLENYKAENWSYCPDCFNLMDTKCVNCGCDITPSEYQKWHGEDNLPYCQYCWERIWFDSWLFKIVHGLDKIMHPEEQGN